jgi:anti-anti-sigma factor
MKPASPQPDERAFAVRATVGWVTLIAVSGELDLATVERFDMAWSSIDFSSVARAVLDLRELEFIDLTGMRSVVALSERCRIHSVQLLIKPGPRAVRRVFELTGAWRVLSFDNDQPEVN